MPVKKSKVKSQKAKVVEETPVIETSVTNPKIKFITIGLLVLIVLAALVWKFKTLFVVAVVNNRPVTRYELEGKLMSRYGKQTLDEIVNERLVTEKAEQEKVVVTTADVDTKVAELTKMLAGQTTLEAALTQQGLTMEEFRRQIYLQSLVEKIAEPQVQINDQEINDYIAQNKTYLTATEEGAIRQEATTALKRQKISEVFGKIFEDLKAKAKVLNFLQ